MKTIFDFVLETLITCVIVCVLFEGESSAFLGRAQTLGRFPEAGSATTNQESGNSTKIQTVADDAVQKPYVKDGLSRIESVGISWKIPTPNTQVLEEAVQELFAKIQKSEPDIAAQLEEFLNEFLNDMIKKTADGNAYVSANRRQWAPHCSDILEEALVFSGNSLPSWSGDLVFKLQAIKRGPFIFENRFRMPRCDRRRGPGHPAYWVDRGNVIDESVKLRMNWQLTVGFNLDRTMFGRRVKIVESVVLDNPKQFHIYELFSSQATVSKAIKVTGESRQQAKPKSNRVEPIRLTQEKDLSRQAEVNYADAKKRLENLGAVVSMSNNWKSVSVELTSNWSGSPGDWSLISALSENGTNGIRLCGRTCVPTRECIRNLMPIRDVLTAVRFESERVAGAEIMDLQFFQQLRELALPNTDLISDVEAAQIIRNMPFMTDCSPPPTVGRETLGVLRRCRHLRYLWLFGADLVHANLWQLKSHPNLQCVNFGKTRLDELELEFLSTLPKLDCITFEGPLSFIGKMCLESCKSLERIELKGVDLNSYNSNDLFSECGRLKILKLTNCNGATKELADRIERNANQNAGRSEKLVVLVRTE